MSSWYKTSVGSAVNKILKEKNISFKYDGSITFEKNIELMVAQGLDKTVSQNIITNSLSLAFSQKYGDYDYSFDMRALYPDWVKPINFVFEQNKINDLKNLNIVDMGANCGKELFDIFGKEIFNNKITLVDIGQSQIDKGRNDFPMFNFQLARMEDTKLGNENFDIYLNLRAIQSSGVNQELAISESHRVLKDNGIAIISVANGYVDFDKDGKKIPVKGLIHEGEIHEDLAEKLATNISEIMRSVGYKECKLLTGLTEVFATGIK